jgi:hypothetical protein
MAITKVMGDTRAGRFNQTSKSVTLDNGAQVYRGVTTNSKKVDSLVYQNGDNEQGIPMPAVATAFVTGEVISFEELVEAIHADHKSPALIKALEKVTGGKFAPKE